MIAFALRAFGACLLLLGLAACAPEPAATAPEKTPSPDTSTAKSDTQGAEFVRVQGRQFVLDGKAYYPVGVNFWFGAYLGAEGEQGDRARLLKELDLLHSLGVNNLRVLAVSEDSELVRAVRPAIVNAKGEFNESLLQGLDFLLAEMAKRNMTAVLYLNNFWQWSGGMSQYVAWHKGTPVLDPDVTGEWNAFMQNSAEFYRIADAQVRYHQVIKTLTGRVNSITGIAYHQDPTIMSWQLANEPRPGSDADGRPNVEVYIQWIKTTARLLHQLAPQQLVSTGSEGVMGSIGDPAVYVAAHELPEVDYLTFHMWAKNWGWFDAKNPAATFTGSLEKAAAYIDTHIDIANRLGKPTVLEEFGLDRDGGAFAADSGTQYRDIYYQTVFNQLHERAVAGDAIAGYNIWAWGGYGRSQRADFIWQPGDDFMGDPPQEPQGLNSVLASDASTLAIIKQSTADFASLAVTEKTALP